MSKCTIDHSKEDVIQKFKEQQPFLPAELYENGVRFIEQGQDQEMLNEVFHLLKKYDLADADERKKRDIQMKELF